MQVALKPLLCAGDGGNEYLKFAPQIQCWRDEHKRIVAWDVVAMLIYFFFLPALIAYVLFRLVPKYGLESDRLNRAFGFLWCRFEARIYWWEARDWRSNTVQQPCKLKFAKSPVFDACLIRLSTWSGTASDEPVTEA